MKSSDKIPAVILNFLYSENEWRAGKKDVWREIHREIKDNRDVHEIKFRYAQIHKSIRSANIYHTSFQPKPVPPKKLLLLAKYKLASLDIPPEYWDEAFFVILPPWEPDLEKALLTAIENKMGEANTIPVAVGMPAYVSSTEANEDRFYVVGFQLRRNIFIRINGKLRAKPIYIGQAQANNIASA